MAHVGAGPGKGREQEQVEWSANKAPINSPAPLEYASGSGNRRPNIDLGVDIAHRGGTEDSDSEGGGVALHAWPVHGSMLQELDFSSISEDIPLFEDSVSTPKGGTERDGYTQVSKTNTEARGRYLLGPYGGRVDSTANDCLRVIWAHSAATPPISRKASAHPCGGLSTPRRFSASSTTTPALWLYHRQPQT